MITVYLQQLPKNVRLPVGFFSRVNQEYGLPRAWLVCRTCPAKRQSSLQGVSIRRRISNISSQSVSCPSRYVGIENWTDSLHTNGPTLSCPYLDSACQCQIESHHEDEAENPQPLTEKEQFASQPQLEDSRMCWELVPHRPQGSGQNRSQNQ